MPEHLSSIITSKGYGSESKFMAIATALNKVHVEGDTSFVETPYIEEIKTKK